MENLTGQSLKGYELLERIGTGGFGAVYRAYQSTVGREVAVKVVLPHFADKPEFIRRFEAEAQFIARLEHLHIVPLYDYWREPGGAYLVMRWLRGGSIKEALREGPFGLESTAELLDQICAALTTAHSSDVIHRDLKPSNILLDEEGNAYLADFGIAFDLRSPNGDGDPGESLTGSPAYLAPEQIRGEQLSPRADIYSLGVTLHEMLTGRHPFQGLNAVELLYKQINDPLPGLDTVPQHLRTEIDQVIQTATSKDPRQRYSDPFSLAAAFRQAARLKEREVAEQAGLLTDREQEVLQLIADGLTNREIAQALYVEHATVKWYIRQIYRKLDVRGRRQAIAWAKRIELAQDGGSADELDTTSLSLDRPPIANPYKGLRSFAAADRDDFFGREEQVDRLLEQMKVPPLSQRKREEPEAGRFLAVVGPSGSGKSSLVSAGLVPAIWEGRLPGSDRWYVVEMNPGDRPLDELEVALIRVASDQADNLRDQLGRDRHGLLRASELILPKDDSELVLVIDQFEELFGLVEDEQERTHFLDLLTSAVTDRGSRLRVVLTLRADYYDRPLHYPEFGQLIRRNTETLLPLKAEELDRAIVAPAEALGVTFEAGLPATIIDQVLYRPGALPLLQYALTELFEQREDQTLTHQAYVDIGGTTGALAKRAEELYLEQAMEGRAIIRQLFLRLVSVDQDESSPPDARRRVPRTEILALGSQEDLLDEIIDLFSAYRLLTLDHDPATRRPTIEVAHEALLREWDRLRDWLDDSRADLRMERQLARIEQEWQLAGQDPSYLLRGTRLELFEAWSAETELALTGGERQYLQASAARRDQRSKEEAARQEREARLKRRSQRILQALVAVLLLAVIISGWFAFDANRNFARSESQRLAAESMNVTQRDGSAELAALLALQGLGSHYSLQADLALQAAAVSYVDSIMVETPGGSYWPHVSPDNRYLSFMRDDPEGLGPPSIEVWDIQSVKQLWQASGLFMPGLPWNERAFTADSSSILAMTGDGLTLQLLDAGTGQVEIALEGNSSHILDFQVSNDGRLVMASTEAGTVHIWDLETGEELFRFQVGPGGYSRAPGQDLPIAISSETGIALAMADGLVHLWDVDTGEELRTFEVPEGNSSRAQFTDDGRLLLIAFDRSVSLWDLETGQELEHDLPAGYGGLLSPDGRVYAKGFMGQAEQDLILVDVDTGRQLHRLTGHSDGARPVAFADQGQTLVTWGWEGSIRFWDISNGREELTLVGHTDAIQDAALSPGERYLVSTGQDQTLRVWDLQSPLHLDYRLDWAHSVLQYSPDGTTALTADPVTGQAVLIDQATLEVIHRLDFRTNPLFDGSTARPLFSHDGQFVVGADDLGTILVYEVSSGQLIGQHSTSEDVYKHPVFVPGRLEILAGGNYGAYLVDPSSGDTIRVLDAAGTIETSPFSHNVAVSGDGRLGAMHVIYEEIGHIVHVWDLGTGNQVFQTDPHPNDHTVAFAFSADSRYFAWGGTGNIAYIVDLTNGQEVAQLSHLDSVHNLDFSTDTEMLLSSTGGDGVILWNIETEEMIRRFFAGSGQAGFARFVGDESSVLYSTFEDGVIHHQSISVDGLVETMCSHLTRDLTVPERQTYGIDNSVTCPRGSRSDR